MTDEIQNKNPFIQSPIQFNEVFTNQRNENELNEMIDDCIDKYESIIN